MLVEKEVTSLHYLIQSKIGQLVYLRQRFKNFPPKDENPEIVKAESLTYTIPGLLKDKFFDNVDWIQLARLG
jgi:hypothetical protein